MRMKTRLESNGKIHLNPLDNMKCKNLTVPIMARLWKMPHMLTVEEFAYVGAVGMWELCTFFSIWPYLL